MYIPCNDGVNSNHANMMLPFITLGKPLHAGSCFQFYEIQGQPHRWAKKAEYDRVKRYPLGVTVTYSMKLYTLLKYGVPDVMQYECNQWRRMPQELHPYLLREVTLSRTSNGDRVLSADKVMDFDGMPSRSLNDMGKIANPSFWKAVEVICDSLERHNLVLLGVFHGGNQLLVQKVSELEWKPIILDLTKIGRRMYPFQPDLWFRFSLKKKFCRQLSRFRNRFMVSPAKETEPVQSAQ
jgi:hypothetical protein